VIVLLDGEIKKRNDIPARTLERKRSLHVDVVRRTKVRGRRGKSR
jgi:hypothetical protein